jgi:hypothetical protein
MILSSLCAPALIYLIFSIIHIVIDTREKRYDDAVTKSLVMVLFTLLLQLLCLKGFHLVSWIIVFIPFIFYTYMITIVYYVFGSDPSKSDEKIKSYLVN